MGWNGSGTFTRSYDWTNERDAGYKINAAKFDTENENFTDGINACLTKNGENAATGNLPMGGNIHTGVGDGTARAHYASVGQVQDSAVIWGGTSGGAANVQTITLTPAITAYAAGQRFAFIPGFVNTAAVTLNVNSIGAKSIENNGQVASGGSLRTDSVTEVIYDGTVFQIVSGGIRKFCDLYDFTTTQNITTGSTDDLSIASETSDLWAMHSTSSDTERINIDAGLWLVTAAVTFSAVGGSSFLRFRISGSTTYYETALAAGQTSANISGLVRNPSGTAYITVSVENGSGSDITVATLRAGAARVG